MWAFRGAWADRRPQARTVEAGRAALAANFPFLMFLVFVLTLPLEAAFVLELAFTIRLSYLVLLALVVVMVIQTVLEGGGGSFRSPLNAPLAIYLAVATLSLVVSIVSPPPVVSLAPEVGLRGSDLRSVFQLGLLGLSAMAYFATVYFCSDAARIPRVVRVYVGCAAVLAGYGVYQFLAHLLGLPFVDITNALGTGGGVYHATRYADWYYFRAHGTFQEPLNFGHYLVGAMLLAVALAVYRARNAAGSLGCLRRYWPAIGAMTLAVLLTRARGPLVALAVGLTVVVLLGVGGVRARIVRTVVVSAGIAALVLALLWPRAYDMIWGGILVRFAPSELVQDPRLSAWPYTVALFREHPILGVGLGNYALHKAADFGERLPGTAYGVFWQTLAETGLLGFFALMLLLGCLYLALFRALRRARGSTWYPYVLGSLASLTAMLLQHASFGDRLSLYVWFVMGVAMAVVNAVNREFEVSR